MTINLRKSNSRLQEALASLADGVSKRRATIPYVHGHNVEDHVNMIHKVLQSSGGLANNTLLTYHKADGGGFNSADGESVAYSSPLLKTAAITKGNKSAEEAIAACRTLVNQAASAVGKDNPEIVRAKGQLALVEPSQGAGMSVFDFISLLVSTSTQAIQAVAKVHSKLHPEGPHVAARVPHGTFDANAPESDEENPTPAAPAAGNQPLNQPAASAPVEG